MTKCHFWPSPIASGILDFINVDWKTGQVGQVFYVDLGCVDAKLCVCQDQLASL